MRFQESPITPSKHLATHEDMLLLLPSLEDLKVMPEKATRVGVVATGFLLGRCLVSDDLHLFARSENFLALSHSLGSPSLPI